MPDLLAASALAGFPGAPFPDAIVKSAGESVRRDAGWHIAPEISETVVVESHGGRFLFLPTLHLSSVTAVRNVTDPNVDPVVVTNWRTEATPRFRAGVLESWYGWPCGLLEVDIVHGHEACPADLLPAVAARCQASQVNQMGGSVRLGSLSVTPPSGTSALAASDSTVAAYKILRP